MTTEVDNHGQKRTTGEGEESQPIAQRHHVGALIGTLVAGAFVMILNETVMGVALPVVMADFGVTAADGQWLTTVFMLTMAIIIPMSGYLLQRFPARRVFVAALVLFSAGTALAAFAPAFWVLVLARVVQAMGTAVIMPLLTTTILNNVPAQRRGRMMGLMAIVISVAPALGPTISGALTSAAGWRSIFFVVLPIAIVVLVVGVVLVRGAAPGVRVPFDVLSALLSALGFGGLLYGLGSLSEAASGGGALRLVIPLGVGLVGLLAFIWRQVVLQRTDSAMLDLRPFRSRAFWVGALMLLVVMAALFGTFILLPLYLQGVLGLSPLQTGLMVLPGGLLMGAAAPFTGALFDRVGSRPLAIPGAAIVVVGLSLFTLFSEATPVWLVVASHIVLNLGLALIMTPIMTGSLGSLPPHLYPHGSAIITTLQQFAGALGTAVFVSIMALGVVNAARGGLGEVAAQAAGVRLAFEVAATVSVLVLGLAFFTPRRAVNPSSRAVAPQS